MSRIVDPLIADLQHEHERAVRDGHVWRSRVVHIAGWLAFSRVFAICIWRDDLAPRNWTSEDRRKLVRALACSVALIVVMTALLEIPPMRTWMALSVRSASMWFVLLTLVPQALAVTVTVGATLGAVYAVGGRSFSKRMAEAVVVLALVPSALSFANVGWITPASNQAFRVAISGRSDLRKGPPELTLGELSQAIETVRREPTESSAWHFGNPPLHLKDLRLHYHTRWALVFSPLLFVVFAVSLAVGVSRRRWLLAVLVCGAFFGYYMLLFGGRRLVFDGAVSAFVAAWSPNAVVALIASLLFLRDSSRAPSHEQAR